MICPQTWTPTPITLPHSLRGKKRQPLIGESRSCASDEEFETSYNMTDGVIIFMPDSPCLLLECGSTLYIGLTGILRTLIQMSTGIVPPFFPPQRLKRVSDYTGAVMNE